MGDNERYLGNYGDFEGFVVDLTTWRNRNTVLVTFYAPTEWVIEYLCDEYRCSRETAKDRLENERFDMTNLYNAALWAGVVSYE